MFVLNDFCELYCISKRTATRRLKIIVPMLKSFKPNSRKHFYTIDEFKTVIKFVGIPPENSFKRQLVDSYPDLFH